MWQIIKAEYQHTLFGNRMQVLTILIIALLVLYIFPNSSGFILYILLGGTILSFHDDNRFYIFQILPVTPKQIAIARLLMLTINLCVLLLFVSPYILYFSVGFPKTISQLFLLFGLLYNARLVSQFIADVISGCFPKKRRALLFRLALLIIPIIFAFIYVTSIYFKTIYMNTAIMILSYSLIPVLTYVSVKIFEMKERVVVKERK